MSGWAKLATAPQGEVSCQPNTITNKQPVDDNYKLLPPILRGDMIGEDSSERKVELTDKYGIFSTPEQFLEKARALQHHLDCVFALEDITREKPFWNAHQMFLL